jgi:outer membrane protein
MKRVLLLLTALFFVCTTYAAELKVGVVNLDEVLQKSGLAMQLNAKISTDFQPRQDLLNAAQKKLQDSVDQLTFTAYKLSPEQRQNLQNQINTQRRDLEKMNVALQSDLAAAQNTSVQTLLTKLNTVIQKIAKDGQYDMITSTANMLYLNNSINLTPQVIDQLK